MNTTEKKMLEILRNLKDACNISGVKAEFEAEGTRTDELLRLLEIARKSDVKVALKIGGCEAVRDLIEAKQFGVEYIIAPMVETPYALQKFIDSKNKVYRENEQSDVQFLVNIETKTGFEHQKQFATLAASKNGIQGLVFGRVDYVGSRGLGRDMVDNEIVTNDIIEVAESCKSNKLDLVVGGGISDNAIKSLKKIKSTYLSRFETRKIVFSAEILNTELVHVGLKNAVHFELLWLKNKKEYYSIISNEDDIRLKMLEARWQLLNEK